MKETENWKDVIGYEGYYEVSDLGNIRHWRRDRNDWVPKAKKKREDGYVIVKLSKKGDKSTKLVHRLVALAFIDNPDDKETVNHISRDKSDNSVGNLEWMTQLENNQAYEATK